MAETSQRPGVGQQAAHGRQGDVGRPGGQIAVQDAELRLPFHVVRQKEIEGGRGTFVHRAGEDLKETLGLHAQIGVGRFLGLALPAHFTGMAHSVTHNGRPADTERKAA